jgi:hypothetical protein
MRLIECAVTWSRDTPSLQYCLLVPQRARPAVDGNCGTCTYWQCRCAWLLQEGLPTGSLEMNDAAQLQPGFIEEAALEGWLDTTLHGYK